MLNVLDGKPETYWQGNKGDYLTVALKGNPKVDEVTLTFSRDNQLPAKAAEAKLTAEIIRKTKKYEPRAQVLEVSYETSRSQQGNIRPKVVINIV